MPRSTPASGLRVHIFLNSGEDDDAICLPKPGADGADIPERRRLLPSTRTGRAATPLSSGRGSVDTAEYAASLIEIGDGMPEYLRLFESRMAIQNNLTQRIAWHRGHLSLSGTPLEPPTEAGFSRLLGHDLLFQSPNRRGLVGQRQAETGRAYP
jgi:hypothetical protein